MENHLLDGGEESQNFESFQEYPSFDNGIMDIDIMDNGIINNQISNNGILDLETIIPETVKPGTMNSRAIDIETINTEIPFQQTFDPGISETSNSFDQAIVSGTIDSRSFTHTEAEWQKIQAGEPTVNYVDATDSWDNYREEKPRNFFRTLLAFFVSIIVAGVLALINVMLYDIEYISTMQFLLSMLPPIGLFTCYYYMIGKRKMDVPEGLLLIVVNEILSYIMFHSVMAHNVQKVYPEISFQEAWRFVDVMKMVSDMKRIYYEHFAIIFGLASLIGIVYGLLGIMGMMEQYGVRRRRY